MLRLSSLFLLLLIGALPGCEMLGPGEGEVSARSIGDGLFVTNSTQARIYYFIVGRGTAASSLWQAHLNQEQSVARGKTARIDHDDIFRSETEREVIVNWWRADGRGLGRKPGEIHSFVVRL